MNVTISFMNDRALLLQANQTNSSPGQESIGLELPLFTVPLNQTQTTVTLTDQRERRVGQVTLCIWRELPSGEIR